MLLIQTYSIIEDCKYYNPNELTGDNIIDQTWLETDCVEFEILKTATATSGAWGGHRIR